MKVSKWIYELAITGSVNLGKEKSNEELNKIYIDKIKSDNEINKLTQENVKL